MSVGRLFQTLGPATSEARVPIVDSLNGGTTRRLVPAERRDCWPGRSATRTTGPRYSGAIPCRTLNVNTAIFYTTCSGMRSQWKLTSASVMWSKHQVYKSTARLHSALAGGGVPGVSEEVYRKGHPVGDETDALRELHWECVDLDWSTRTVHLSVVSVQMLWKTTIDNGRATLLSLDLCASSSSFMGSSHNWLRSYLSNRSFSVTSRSSSSFILPSSCGVSQGSILGPILFTIYVSPVASTVFSHGVNQRQYAYDTQLFLLLSPASSSSSLCSLQRCISRPHSWFIHNCLVLKLRQFVLTPAHDSNRFHINFHRGGGYICSIGGWLQATWCHVW